MKLKWKQLCLLMLVLCIAVLLPMNASANGNYMRISGENRFETAFQVADTMKETLGVDKFQAVIIASGTNFADALSGSYLANVKVAPILLSFNDTYNEKAKTYIRENLAENGTVYILGGTAAVSESMETGLEGYTVKRLAGSNRFETNLLILQEAGVSEGQEVLVCTGTNFADSLSASAVGLPILLVFNESGKLMDSQSEYLATLSGNRFCVIGGESAVGVALEDAVGAYGETERLAGSNRFETSVLVAERYFESPETAVLAYAWNYPDGLCGGPLAYAMGCPLILTMTNYERQADDYTDKFGIDHGTVLGGEKLISDESCVMIFDAGVEGHSHSYTVTYEASATCARAGERRYTCNCGDSYTETIPAGHNWAQKHIDEVGHYDYYLVCHCGGWSMKADPSVDPVPAFEAHCMQYEDYAEHSYYESKVWVIDTPASDYWECTRCCEISYSETPCDHTWDYHWVSPGHWGERHLKCDLCGWVLLESETEPRYMNLTMQEHAITVHGLTEVRDPIYEDEPDVFLGRTWCIIHQWIADGEEYEYWECTQCGETRDEAPCEHQWDYTSMESQREESCRISPYDGGQECACGWHSPYKYSTHDGFFLDDYMYDHALENILHPYHEPAGSDVDLVIKLAYSVRKCRNCGQIVTASDDRHDWHPIDSALYTVWQAPGTELASKETIIRGFDQEHNWILDSHEENQYTYTTGVETSWTDIWKCADCGITTTIFQNDSLHEYYDYAYIDPDKYNLWQCADCGALTLQEPEEYKAYGRDESCTFATCP